MPGSHSVSKPCIRALRVSVSCSVIVSACPTCNRPVTFGGGIEIENGSRSDGIGWKYPRRTHSSYHLSSADFASYCDGMSVRFRVSWAITVGVYEKRSPPRLWEPSMTDPTLG